jgi:hypothetical protein
MDGAGQKREKEIQRGFGQPRFDTYDRRTFGTTWPGSPDHTARAAERDYDYGLAILSLILV